MIAFLSIKVVSRKLASAGRFAVPWSGTSSVGPDHAGEQLHPSGRSGGAA